jgi:superfamily II DNA/RNA helicase
MVMISTLSQYRKPHKSTKKQAIAFCADVAHAGALAQSFEAEGVPAANIHGAMDAGDRRAALARFREGELSPLMLWQSCRSG